MDEKIISLNVDDLLILYKEARKRDDIYVCNKIIEIVTKEQTKKVEKELFDKIENSFNKAK